MIIYFTIKIMKTSVQCRGTTRTCPGAFYIPFDWIHVILCFAVQIGIKTFNDLVNTKSILKKVISEKLKIGLKYKK